MTDEDRMLWGKTTYLAQVDITKSMLAGADIGEFAGHDIQNGELFFQDYGLKDICENTFCSAARGMPLEIFAFPLAVALSERSTDVRFSRAIQKSRAIIGVSNEPMPATLPTLSRPLAWLCERRPTAGHCECPLTQ